MRQEEVERDACRILALAYHSIGDYSQPCDGFCDLCPCSGDPESFRHHPKVLDYVRQAVLEKLRRDGYEIGEGFDLETGKDLTASPEKDAELAIKRAEHRVWSAEFRKGLRASLIKR